MGLAKKLLIGVVALPVLFVCGSYIRNKAVGPEGWAMDNTVARLRAQFKDPDSVQIRASWTVVKPAPAGGTRNIYICGLVDGKNSFGAYPGAVRFVSHSIDWTDMFDTKSVTVEDPSDTATAHGVSMRSGFEKVYWDPNCETSTKT